jgi:hypothetical protein
VDKGLSTKFVMPRTLFLSAALLGLACGGSSEQTCLPGQQYECACSGDETGFQTCDASGEAFSECDCGVGASSAGGAATGGVGGGGAPDPALQWDCLEGFQPPPLGRSVIHRLRFEGAFSGSAPPSGIAQLCNILDAECAAPIHVNTLGANGAFEIEVGPSFDGYLAVEASGFLDSFVLLPRPVTIPQVERTIPLFSESDLASAAGRAGIDLDPDSTTALVLATNCFDQPAVGVDIESDVAMIYGAVPFYLTAAGFDFEATETDGAGRGGFLNIRPEPMGFELKIAGTRDGIGRTTAPLRLDGVNYVLLGPTADE